jgi:hypothetical protein
MISNKIKRLVSILTIITFLISSAFLSGCIEPAKVRPSTESILTISKTIINNSYQQSISWLKYNLNQDNLFNETYNFSSNTSSIKPEVISQFNAAVILSNLSNSNNSYLLTHEKNINQIIKNYYIEINNTGFFMENNESNLELNILGLNMIVDSPFYQDYQKIASKIATEILNNQNQSGKLIFKNQSLSDYDELIYAYLMIVSLTKYYERSYNPIYFNAANTTYEYYVTIINQLNNPLLLPSKINMLSYKFYITNNEDLKFEILNLGEELIKKQEIKKLNSIGSFNENKSDIIFNALATESLAKIYKMTDEDNDTDNKSIFRKHMLLSIYNILNHQINKSDNKNIHAAFTDNLNEDEIDLLDSTVQSILTIHKISNIMPENDWIYIYDGDESTFIISTFKGQNEGLWIALSMGVLIASIILIGTYVIYYYIVKRKK